jgi:hypothetical protein
MSGNNISKAQLKRLQTLWSMYARHNLINNSREERLRWSNSELGKNSAIASFRELSSSEASTLINTLQGQLGIRESRPARAPRRRLDRDQAQAAGTEGRRGSRKNLTLATSEDLALIDEQLQLMGWDRARLDAFLRSPSSPLRGRSSIQLRTVADVNRVLWPLRRIARDAKKREAAV